MKVAEHKVLIPKFYTTDFEEVAKLNYSSHEAELKNILERLRNDNNNSHFTDNQNLKDAALELDELSKQWLINFFYRSCLSEFAGFLLYKNLEKRLKDSHPLLSECFSLMARDEARHSGAMAKAMSQLNCSINLGSLAKKNKRVFFKPRFIYYALYLSEKLGYLRYQVLAYYLEANPQYIIHPIFKTLLPWCEDENLHGDFWAFILKSQPHLFKRWIDKLWCRFFLLSHFAMLYLRDMTESGFFTLFNLDPKVYNQEVIAKTNAIAGEVYPIILNVEHSEFYSRLDICAKNNQSLKAIDESKKSKTVKFMSKVPFYMANCWQLLRLYLIKPIETQNTNIETNSNASQSLMPNV